jgi:hypothetical protein
MDKSKFNLWRACFSFCFVDGFLSKEEQNWIETKLNSLPFSQDQKTLLMSDLKNSPDIDQLLPLIDRPADKGFLVNTMRTLSQLDHEISAAEKMKIENVLKVVMSRIDVESLSEETSRIKDKRSYIDTVISALSVK